MWKLNSRHFENERLVPRTSRCFFKGHLPNGVGRQVNHMFIYFHQKIRKLKLFVNRFSSFFYQSESADILIKCLFMLKLFIDHWLFNMLWLLREPFLFCSFTAVETVQRCLLATARMLEMREPQGKNLCSACERSQAKLHGSWPKPAQFKNKNLGLNFTSLKWAEGWHNKI